MEMREAAVCRAKNVYQCNVHGFPQFAESCDVSNQALLKCTTAWDMAQVVRDVAGAVVAQLLERQAGRLGIPADVLFPQWPLMRRWLLPTVKTA